MSKGVKNSRRCEAQHIGNVCKILFHHCKGKKYFDTMAIYRKKKSDFKKKNTFLPFFGGILAS